MKESKAIHVTKHKIKDDLKLVYQLFRSDNPSQICLGKSNFSAQYDSRRDNEICTCKHVITVKKRNDIRCYGGPPKQVYAYHAARNFDEIGVGSIKALYRRKARRIYLPETENTGVGSSDLSPYFYSNKNIRVPNISHYFQKRTSSKCVGGILEYNNVCVINEKLSPIILTKSDATSPDSALQLKNTEIGSNTVEKKMETIGTQFETENDADKRKIYAIETKLEPKIIEIKPARKTSEQTQKYTHSEKTAVDKKTPKLEKERKVKEFDKTSSSDSLVQHVHNLENPSIDKHSKSSFPDTIENTLEREYRKMFSSSKSKESKPSYEKHGPEFKSASVLRRRFEALKRGIIKKESSSSKNDSMLMKMSKQDSIRVQKDVSVTSDPPSLVSRSFSNSKKYAPVIEERIELDKNKSPIYEKEKHSPQWQYSDSQGVKGMFKLWGKKFNFEEDAYGKKLSTPMPSFDKTKPPQKEVIRPIKLIVKKSKKQTKSPIQITNKKEGKKFFFFKKKNKKEECNDKSKELYTSKKNVTAGRCELKDGLVLNIGCYTTSKAISKTPEERKEIIRSPWLKKFVSKTIESTKSVNIRWNNNMYATSSSTIFELLGSVYKNSGFVITSRSETSATFTESSYKSFTKHKVNFVRDIEAWMIPKTIHQIPIKDIKLKFNSDKEIKEKNIDISFSDQKWFIEKSEAVARKIELVLYSNNSWNAEEKKVSSEYLKIDIPKDFFSSSSESKRNLSSDEKVYKIVEYETNSEIKRGRKAISDSQKGYRVSNDFEVTVSVRDSKNLEAKILETVIKRPPILRDVVIQGSNVKIPQRCDVIGVGIITQRDLREIRKPILKIQDDFTDDDLSGPEPQINQKKCEFAESYLQEYYRNWTPLGIDFYSWCVSDSQLRSCSEKSIQSFHNQGDGSKSCPNIYDDFQAATNVASGETSSDTQYTYEYQSSNSNKFTDRFFKKFKKVSKAKPASEFLEKRILPKDSLEVFKRRKIYAASAKSQWIRCNAADKPVSVPSVEGKMSFSTLKENQEKINPAVAPKPKSRNKRVSMSDCETVNTQRINKEIQPSKPLYEKTETPLCNTLHTPTCNDFLRLPNDLVSTETPFTISERPSLRPSIPHMPSRCSSPKLPCTSLYCPSGLPPCVISRTCTNANPCAISGPLSNENDITSTGLSTSEKKTEDFHLNCENCRSFDISPNHSILSIKKSISRCEIGSSNSPSTKYSQTPVKKSSPFPSKTCSPLCSVSSLVPLLAGSKESDSPSNKIKCSPNPDYKESSISLSKDRSLTCEACLSPASQKPLPLAPTSSLNKSNSPFTECPPVSSFEIRRSQQKTHISKEKCGSCSPCMSLQSVIRKPLQIDPSEYCHNMPLCDIGDTPKSKKLKSRRSPKTTQCQKQKREECASQTLSRNSLEPCGSLKQLQSRQAPCLPPSRKQCFSPVPKRYPKRLEPPRDCPAKRSPATPSNQCDNRISPKASQNTQICQDCPWPTDSRISNQSSQTSCVPVPANPKPSSKCPKSCSTENAGLNYSPQCLSTKKEKDCKPDCQSRQKINPPTSITSRSKSSPDTSSMQKPDNPPAPSCQSQSEFSAINIKLNVPGISINVEPISKRCCSPHSTASTNSEKMQSEVKSSSYDKIIKKSEEKSSNTEKTRQERRGPIHIKVKDADGRTLYERKDYICGSQRESLVGDLFRESKINRVATPVVIANQEQKNVSACKSDHNLANLVEIHFKLRITQGDKTTEVNIGNEVDDEKKQEFRKTAPEVFIVNNGAKNIAEDIPKNDINIKITIQNCKTKSTNAEDKRRSDKFSKIISEKFQTVSTGYSDLMGDEKENHVYSLHKATINLSSSAVTSNSRSRTSNEQPSKELTEFEHNLTVSSQSIEQIPTDITEDENVADKTIFSKKNSQLNNIEETNTNASELPDFNDTDEQVCLSALNTSDECNVESVMSNHTSNENKKELLKKVIQKAGRSPVKNKETVRELRDMLKIILTDSSDNEEQNLNRNDLLNDVTYTSLKPNYFRDTDSMNNYYQLDKTLSLLKDSKVEVTRNPIREKRSRVSGSSESDANDITFKGCMCERLAEKLNQANIKMGCCCRQQTKRNEETNCDMRNDLDFFLLNYKTAEYFDVETQNSKYSCGKVNNVSVSFHGNNKSFDKTTDGIEVVEKIEIIKSRDSRKSTKTIPKRKISGREAEVQQLYQNAAPGVSNYERVTVLNDKPSKRTMSVNDGKNDNLHDLGSDILQSYAAKKAVLEIYAKKTDNGDHFVAKLPKFVDNTEKQIVKNYEKMATDSYKSVCRQNIVMMSVAR